MTPSLLPTHTSSLLPQHLAFNATEQSLLDELYETAEIDAICDALFAVVEPGAPLPRA
jgi:hypothetical protein